MNHDQMDHDHHAGHAATTLAGHAHAAAPTSPATFNKHAGHSAILFRNRFWVALAVTVPVLIFSETIQDLLGYRIPDFAGQEWVVPVLSTFIFFYGGRIFLTSAVRELAARLPGMMTLISLAIISAFGYSIATTFFVVGPEFFWELSTLITVMLFGHWMEMRAVQQTQGALKHLAKLLPDTAELFIPQGPQGELRSHTESVPVDQLRVGDLVLVRPGAKVPADGVVTAGESSVDESIITGESKPVQKTTGSQVIAGAVNGSGSLTVRVTKIGEATALAGIMRLVADAQSSRSRTQLLADRAALVLTLTAISVGVVTLVTWLSLDAGAATAVERTVSVLVIACPHALGLAIPLVATIATTLSARNGILVRKREALESARTADVVLFDKTGTLTLGKQGVSDVVANHNTTEREVIQYAASVENHSEHPLGRALVARAKKLSIPLRGDVTNFKALAGQGVQAVVNRARVMVGTPELVRENGADLQSGLDLQQTPQLAARFTELAAQGKTVVVVSRADAILGLVAFADEVRPESREAVSELHRRGFTVAMLTGDSEQVAKAVAAELNIKEYFAEVKPADKAATVRKLQSAGKRVIMVGDGVNDAPALTQADIGVAIGAGTDVAIESASILLVKNDPRDVVKIVGLSSATYKKMVQNLVWATAYNIVAIPLAAGVLASVGIFLPPAIGALLMSGSTVIVALNAQLLRRTQL